MAGVLEEELQLNKFSKFPYKLPYFRAFQRAFFGQIITKKNYKKMVWAQYSWKWASGKFLDLFSHFKIEPQGNFGGHMVFWCRWSMTRKHFLNDWSSGTSEKHLLRNIFQSIIIWFSYTYLDIKNTKKTTSTQKLERNGK